jgi:hypothetical protein
VQRTILDECWKPAFARYLISKYTGLCLDLERYLRYYNETTRLPQGGQNSAAVETADGPSVWGSRREVRTPTKRSVVSTEVSRAVACQGGTRGYRS